MSIPTVAASGILLGGEVIATADAQAARRGAIARRCLRFGGWRRIGL